MRRYPLAPLLEATGLSMAQLNDRIPMGGQTYRKVRTEGLSELVADRWAARLGLHPANVWHDFGMVECEADDCERTFAPMRDGHRFCSDACGSRIRRRVRYQVDADYAAARRAVAAAYYQTCGDYVRERERRRYRARTAA